MLSPRSHHPRSPHGAAQRRVLSVLLSGGLALGLTACVAEDDPLAEDERAADEPGAAALVDLHAPADAPSCAGEVADETIEFAWHDVTPPRDAQVHDTSPPLALRNVTRQDLDVELTAQILGSGGRVDRKLGSLRITAGGNERFAGVPLEVPGGDADFSTQLRVIATIRADGRHLVDLPAPALWFHPVDDGFVVYDDAGLKTRHRAGDVHRLMLPRDAQLVGIDGVGKGRPLSDAELVGDPLDIRDRMEVTP